MKTLVRITFGSHLYGTATPASDIDFKAVHLPPAREILLQRVRDSVSTRRPKGHGEKNFAGEIEEESYSLQKYLRLLSEGQTVALDMLFAPGWAMTHEPSDLWNEIVRNKDRVLTRGAASFVSYCRSQANKYGIKGSRVAASRRALALLEDGLEKYGTTAKLETMADAIEAIVAESEHMAILPLDMPGGVVIPHWEVCNRKMPYRATIKMARDVMQILVNDYGGRALKAERNEGVDWKALSHAVRVGQEALELLSTGRITFPLINAGHIRAIKLGERPYQAVAEEIERLLEGVEAAEKTSALPMAPDFEWIDDFVEAAHRRALVDAT